MSDSQRSRTSSNSKVSQNLVKVNVFHFFYSLLLCAGTVLYVLMFAYHVFFTCPNTGEGCSVTNVANITQEDAIAFNNANLGNATAEGRNVSSGPDPLLLCEGSRRCCDFLKGREMSSQPEMVIVVEIFDRIEFFMLSSAALQTTSLFVLIIFLSYRKGFSSRLRTVQKRMANSEMEFERISKAKMEDQLAVLCARTSKFKVSKKRTVYDDMEGWVDEKTMPGLKEDSDLSKTDESGDSICNGNDDDDDDLDPKTATADFGLLEKREKEGMWKLQRRQRQLRRLLSGLQTIGLFCIAFLDVGALALFLMVFVNDVVHSECIGLYLLSAVWIFQGLQRSYTLPSTAIFLMCRRNSCGSICVVFVKCSQVLFFKLCSSLAVVVALGVAGLVIYFKYFARPVNHVVDLMT